MEIITEARGETISLPPMGFIPSGINPMHCLIQVIDALHFRLGGEDRALSLFVRDRNGAPADLVAWQENKPGEWWLREGDEVPILGAGQLAGAKIMPIPIPIYATPADWAKAAGDGVCILDWGINLRHLFDGVDLDITHLLPGQRKALAERLRDNFKSSEPKIIGLMGAGYEYH